MDVRIRPYRLDDAETIVDAVGESVNDLQPWMPWAHPGYAIEECRAWLDVNVRGFEQGTTFEFAIMSSSGRYLGGCGLNQIEKMNRRANLGYWVRSSATRQGVATTAVRALRDWAFEATDLVRLEILVAVGNIASHRVAEKVGAVREGTLRRRLMLHGRAVDATMFSLTRDDRL